MREVPRRPIRFDHCVLAVRDWSRSNAFYRDVVGADVIGDPDGPAQYRFGDTQLSVHGPGMRPDPAARHPVIPGNSDLCFVWPGPITDAVKHLRAHGVALEQGPAPRAGARDAGTSVYFRDPDGTLLEFISYR
jgi:catechol 2,3-dioxygenase-like lactoylglutathione lyase family enzyme